MCRHVHDCENDRAYYLRFAAALSCCNGNGLAVNQVC